MQNLSETNKADRVIFCQQMLRRIGEDENFSRKILFTDEASFTTAGMFNKKNKHFGQELILTKNKL